MRRWIWSLICLLLVFMLGLPVMAQDLTETYSPSDGSYTISYPAGWTLKQTTNTSFSLAEQSSDLTSGQQPRGVLIYARILSASDLASHGDTMEAMLTGYAASDRRQEIEPAAVEATLPTVIGYADFFGVPEGFALVQISDDTYLYIDAYTPRRNSDDPLLTSIVTSVTAANPPTVSADVPVDEPMTDGGVIRQWAVSATGTSQYASEDWSFDQATGAPNTAECGDNMTAWAASGSDTSEVLALEFATPVLPIQVNIHQTYNPGAIVKVELTNTEDSTIIEIPESADPPGNTECPGVFTLDVTEVTTPVNGVIIYFDQSITGNWNEIDAVELIGVSPDGAGDMSDSGLYNVVIAETGDRKVDLIKAVRTITTLGLTEAKDLVESAPDAIVLENVTAEVANNAKTVLEEAGAVIEIVSVSGDAMVVETTDGPALYNVVIAEVDANTKIDTIKAVRALTSLGLADAKALVDSAPDAIVLEGVTEDVANDAKAQLEETGAVVELVLVQGSAAMGGMTPYTFSTGGSFAYPSDWIEVQSGEGYVGFEALEGSVEINVYGPIPLTPDEAAEFLEVDVEDILPASLADFIENTFPDTDTNWDLMEYATVGETNYVFRTFRTNSDAEVIILAMQLSNGQLAAIQVEANTNNGLDIPGEIKDLIPTLVESVQPGE